MGRLAVFFLFLLMAANAFSGTLRVLALQSERFFEPADGGHSGIEAEILQYFAKARGDELEVEYVSSFTDLLDRIARGDADVAAGTITITPERKTRMEFSAPYFPVQVVLVERVGETSSSLEALSGKVGAFEKTTATDALRTIPGIEVVTSENGLEAMLDRVASGKWRAVAADSSAVLPVIDAYPSLQVSLYFGEQQDFGFALPKGSPLRQALSEHIERLRESNVYFRIVTKYMGPKAGAIVRAARGQ